jgi:hypothetical protein
LTLHCPERYNFGFSGALAQLVEQRTFNPLVGGSNPPRPTNQVKDLASLPPSEVLDLRPFSTDSAQKTLTFRRIPPHATAIGSQFGRVPLLRRTFD